MRFAFAIPLLLTAAALGQTPPATRPPPAPATRPSGLPKNLESALGAPLSVDADALPLSQFADLLRDKTQTNIVVNWNALAQAGITRDTPVTLHLKGLTYENVVRTLVEVLPPEGPGGAAGGGGGGSHANYAVGENTLEITTNAELGKAIASHIYDLSHAVSYTFTPPQTPDSRDQNRQRLQVILRAELVRAGEPMDAKGHDLIVKDDALLANISERGQALVNRALLMFNQPLKVGQLAQGTQLTGPAKKTSDAYKALLASPAGTGTTPEAIARAPGTFSQFNLALLPGTQEELAKDKPDIRYAVSDAGVLLLGPADAVQARTMLVVYDLRDLLKKFAARVKPTPGTAAAPPPGPAEYQKAIVQVLQNTIKPEGDTWGGGDDLGKKPALMLAYDGLLVIFATADTHRMVAAGLQDMNK